jgi:hypothetical protein
MSSEDICNMPELSLGFRRHGGMAPTYAPPGHASLLFPIRELSQVSGLRTATESRSCLVEKTASPDRAWDKAVSEFLFLCIQSPSFYFLQAKGMPGEAPTALGVGGEQSPMTMRIVHRGLHQQKLPLARPSAVRKSTILACVIDLTRFAIQATPDN